MFKDVPNTVDFVAQEHQLLDFWRDSDVFHKLRELAAGRTSLEFYRRSNHRQ